jgi:hypothetical protein
MSAARRICFHPPFCKFLGNPAYTTGGIPKAICGEIPTEPLRGINHRNKPLISEPKPGSAVLLTKDVGKIFVRSKNERVELEMKILKYRQLASRTADEEFLQRIEAQIAVLMQKLREIDE